MLIINWHLMLYYIKDFKISLIDILWLFIDSKLDLSHACPIILNLRAKFGIYTNNSNNQKKLIMDKLNDTRRNLQAMFSSFKKLMIGRAHV